eukprot:TRINITY_DN5846_c0_g3_i1.p1 TRINITY_DN5846_c0_g3~~TRINITY_DN5846_c0_g3_i1.p1  ORF type:complete len:431 (-),score=63.68 TRINITY_DN5846_c0_g3_i1:159-1451(-)
MLRRGLHCCRRCCESFWAIVCAERVSSPALVLGVHAALVADVFVYRPDLWEDVTELGRGVRLLVLTSVLLYLQTVATDPGYVRPSGSPVGGAQGPASACCARLAALLCCSCLCCCRAAISPAQRPKASTPTAEAARFANGEDAASLAVHHPNGALHLPAEAATERDLELAQPVGMPLSDDTQGLLPASPAGPGSADCSGNSPAMLHKAPEGIPQKRRGGEKADDFGLEEEVAAASQSGLEMRWCAKCGVYQPLRTKHCKECGRCIRTHDHHCPWIGSCVGENNRSLFYMYLWVQGIELGVFFVLGVQGISLLDPSIVLLAGLLLIAMFFIMVSCLLSFHTFLMMSNLTTWEHVSWNRITYLKPLPAESGSPFGRSILRNAAMYFFGPWWCAPSLRRFAGLRYEADGAIMWELFPDQRPPGCLLKYCLETC